MISGGAWGMAMRGRRRGPGDLCRRAIGGPPGAREPGRFNRVGALEAALRDCVGLPPVS